MSFLCFKLLHKMLSPRIFSPFFSSQSRRHRSKSAVNWLPVQRRSMQLAGSRGFTAIQMVIMMPSVLSRVCQCAPAALFRHHIQSTTNTCGPLTEP